MRLISNSPDVRVLALVIPAAKLNISAARELLETNILSHKSRVSLNAIADLTQKFCLKYYTIWLIYKRFIVDYLL
mgnify:CR=1